MRVAGQQSIGFTLGEIDERRHQVGEQVLDGPDLCSCPQTEVRGDLLVPAASGVDLVGERSCLFPKFADHEGVNILVIRSREDVAGLRFLNDLIKRLMNRIAFLSGEDADARER